MQEATTPILVPVPQAGNLSNLIADRAWSEPQRIVMSRPIGDGWELVTAKTADEEIRAAAKGLIAAGVSHGDRVAIMARTRDRKSTRLNSSHIPLSRMPSSA